MRASIDAQAPHVAQGVQAAAQLRLRFEGEPVEAGARDVARVGRGRLRQLDILLGGEEQGVREAFPRCGVVLDAVDAVPDPSEFVGGE